MISDEERERQIERLMRELGISRERAEFAVALGEGELHGDTPVVDGDEEKTGSGSWPAG